MKPVAICLIFLSYPILSVIGRIGVEQSTHDVASLPKEAPSYLKYLDLDTSQRDLSRDANYNQLAELVPREQKPLFKSLHEHAQVLRDLRFKSLESIDPEDADAVRKFLTDYFNEIHYQVRVDLYDDLNKLQTAPEVQELMSAIIKHNTLGFKLEDLIELGLDSNSILSISKRDHEEYEALAEIERKKKLREARRRRQESENEATSDHSVTESSSTNDNNPKMSYFRYFKSKLGFSE